MTLKLVTQSLPSIHDQAAYELALAYVDALEPDPRFSRLSRNLYSKDGELLETLDQVIRACAGRQLAGLDEPVMWAEAA